ncbi:MAG: 4Fe-4S binding protein [Candidatus Margulisbacteria bacterium]|nr:4Fe-4S binding protein [Candidatus Margulisiibacteriota bacterium]MBU1021395.1 4Fe-4S binding protein [Candidatus Margulisiibacteriota bacterium]MBU1729116.1 4Fe-4S binding protein [Candidatus Margulisiibacteriota bacterium]MBU1954789.1 4Fe-4S binding protein [Candidatus Margulisiibacteriota bacterium]
MTKPGWKELKLGDVLEAGTAAAFETGDWRSEKPIFHKDRCIHCLQCWIHCPDTSVIVKNQKVEGFDYKHCKGCGICAKVCPVKGEKAITMEPER